MDDVINYTLIVLKDSYLQLYIGYPVQRTYYKGCDIKWGIKQVHLVLVMHPRVREAVTITGVKLDYDLSRLLGCRDVKPDKTVNYRLTY